MATNLKLVSPSKDDEKSLMKRIKAGDSAAFSEYVKMRARYFHAVAYRVTLNGSVAEDVVQSAFTRLWEKRDSLDAENGNLTAWLYRVVVNLAIDDKRRLKYVPLNEEIESGDDTLEELADKRSADDVRRNLELLPPRQRAAVMLVYYEEKPQREAAEIMGINIKALESLLSRAKQGLKEAIGG